MASSPAYSKHPNHRVSVEPNAGSQVRVEVAGTMVAESKDTLRVIESRCQPVVYLPRADVDMSLLEKTEHTTFCPFKGTASYYSIRVGDRVAENAIWSYEDPYDQVADLKDLLAFYPDRVDSLTET